MTDRWRVLLAEIHERRPLGSTLAELWRKLIQALRGEVTR